MRYHAVIKWINILIRKRSKSWICLWILFSAIGTISHAQGNKNPIQLNPKEGIFKTNQTIEFVGSGDLQKSLRDQQSGIPANAGLGVLFKRNVRTIFIEAIEVEASINIASTVDTINWNPASLNRDDFGSYVLLPINSRERASFQLIAHLGPSDQLYKLKAASIIKKKKKNWEEKNDKNSEKRSKRFDKKLKKLQRMETLGYSYPTYFLRNPISGLRLDLIASNRFWSTPTETRKVAATSLRIGIFHDFVPWHDREEFSIRVGLDFSSRFILGDAGFDDMKDFREEILGTPETTFWGFEPYLLIRLKNLKGEVSFPLLEIFHPNKDRRSFVSGLSGAQFVTSIHFVGGFQLALDL